MSCFRKATFTAALVIAVAALAPAAPAGATVIGVIYPNCCAAYLEAVKSLKTELARGGYGAGDADIYEQKPSADPMSWTNSFRKFVGVDADLIIIFGDELLETACGEKTKIPVLFGFVSDPERARCVKSRENPGGNVTGISGRTPVFTLLEKTMKIGKFSTLGVFDLKGDAFAGATLKEIRSHGENLGYEVVPLSVKSRKDLPAALREAPPLDMLFFPNFSAGPDELKELGSIAAGKMLPSISLQPSDPGSPSLLSFYPNPTEQGAMMGRMAVLLLQGEPPSKTSVQEPKKIELEVNIGLAKKLGMKVPMAVLESATKVNR